MKKYLLIVATVVLMATLVFGYIPVTPPPIQPGDPFVWSPDSCPSRPICAVVIAVGTTYTGTLEVTEPDAETVVITDGPLTISPKPITVVKDPNDTQYGLSTISTYQWSWTPPVTAVGINYFNVRVVDPGGREDNGTIVVLVKPNEAPAITGCS